MNKTYNSDGTTVRVFDGYSYEYDKQNRISAIKQLDALGAEVDLYSYEYDKLGQLVRYNDNKVGKSYTYTYDNNGNITEKAEYAYTTGVLSEATDTITYSYDNQWKDKLTRVGDKTIAYDNIGNPTSYLGATLTWQGRELTSYSNDDYTLNYEYDENGMRYRTTVLRTVIDEETNEETLEETNFEYVWADGKLVSLIYTNEDASGTAKYLYNEFDEPIGIVYSDASGFTGTYYYLKNAQGDITCVVDGSGKKQISFTYDAFGEVTECYHATNVTTFPGFVELMVQKAVRLLTPFGYRGYCYDTFTGLYYLQSRYYDPNVGRFINADDTNYLNATGTVLGCNLFAYCENDPVNKVDPKGTLSISANVAGFLLDVAFTAIGSWFKYSYDIVGAGLSYYAKKKGIKYFYQKLLYGVVPKVKGLFSKGFTLIRKAIWRVTGNISANAISTLFGKGINIITSIFSRLVRNNNLYTAFYFIGRMLTLGSLIALILDYVTDWNVYNEVIKIW